MKNIAFKRAKNAPAVKDSLHPEYIVEHADTTLFEADFHKTEDGYEILPEDQFQTELVKNPKLHEEYQAQKAKEEALRINAENAAAFKHEQEDRKAQKEFDEFLAWKASKKK